MSYTGMGAYYTTSPGQIYGPAASGFGLTEDALFDADRVWADVRLGASCYEPGHPNHEMCKVEPTVEAVCGKCNAAGMRATKAIQGGLNRLGFGPLEVDGAWGPKTEGAWERYMADSGLSTSVGIVQESGVRLMGEKLGESKAGIGVGILALVVLGGVGLYAYGKRRKRRSPTIRGRL